MTEIDYFSSSEKETGMPQYKVAELREAFFGMSTAKLEKVLNEHGSRGWVLKTMIAAKISGTDGLLITFEKQ
jgi:Domain of unknown function (DUF4177)